MVVVVVVVLEIDTLKLMKQEVAELLPSARTAVVYTCPVETGISVPAPRPIRQFAHTLMMMTLSGSRSNSNRPGGTRLTEVDS